MLTRRVETRRVQLPPEEWVEEPSNYIFRLYLPQVFKKEDLNIMYDPSGKITIRGIKQMNTNRFVRFDSSYNVPKDSNIEKISGNLENNILSFTIPKIIVVKPSDEKKEELLIEEESVIEEKPKMVVEARKEEEELKVPKEKPTMVEEEKKEKAVIIEKKEEEPVMNKAMQRIDEKMKEEAIQKTLSSMEGKKEEPSLKEKPKIVTEEKKEKEALTVPQEKPMMAEEEKKDAAVLKDMNKESMKGKMAMGERIKEAVDLNELNGKLQTIKEPNLEERKDKTVPDEIKKEEPTVNEKLKDFKEKDEEIQADKLKGFDMEKKEDSVKKEDNWKDAEREKTMHCHETEAQQKQPKKKKSKKRKWLWNEEDKSWLDWMDSAFIDDVLKKVCRNKRFITFALVAFSTGFYISRKLRTRG